MSFQFADRYQCMQSTVVSDTLKLTAIPGVISFAGGMPAPEVFPIDAMRAAADKVLTEKGAQALQYCPTEGHKPLRVKIAQLLKKTENIICTENDIINVNGSQQALDLSGKIFLNPGDVVLCEDPTYPAALTSLGAYQCEFLAVESDDNGMIIEDLEKKLAAVKNIKLIYVIPTFQNPTGRTWSLERRKGLLAAALKYNIPIIEDNPYGELRYEGEKIPSVKSMDKDGIVIYLGSFSKILSPGVRLGYIVASPEILRAYNFAKQGADLQAGSLVQYIVDQYLEDNDLDENLAHLRGVYKPRRDLMMSLVESEFPEGTTYTHPDGGLFLWVQVPKQIDTQKVLEQVVQFNVAYIPGFCFFANGGPCNTLRLNYSNASPEKITEGMKLLGKALKSVL